MGKVLTTNTIIKLLLNKLSYHREYHAIFHIMKKSRTYKKPQKLLICYFYKSTYSNRFPVNHSPLFCFCLQWSPMSPQLYAKV